MDEESRGYDAIAVYPDLGMQGGIERPFNCMPHKSIESARILVVDDEEDVRCLIRDLMRHDGHKVWVAAGVVEAMRLARRETLDLVITDLVMPHSPGYDLIAALYRQSKTYATPILAITADGELVLGHQGDNRGLHSLSSNIAAYVAKPFSGAELRGIVLAVLEAWRAGRFRPGEPYYKVLGCAKRPLREARLRRLDAGR